MRSTFACLALAILTGCGGVQDRPRRAGDATASIIVGTAAVAGLFLVFGLVACADENGGACTIALGDEKDGAPTVGRDLGR